VPPSGRDAFNVFAMIRASSIGVSCFGRPERGRSVFSPASPSASYRSSQWLTVGRENPAVVHLSSPAYPSAGAEKREAAKAACLLKLSDDGFREYLAHGVDGVARHGSADRSSL
jgi:hypothetical protein